MKFRTEIQIPKSDTEINHQSTLLMIGSCFTNSIGQKLVDSKFNICLNPFGTLYNPTSISKALDLLVENKVFTDDDIFFDKGVFNSFYYHSSFSSLAQEDLLNNINQSRQHGSQKLKEADILFVTFGTSYVYEYLKTGEIVGNCHKLPALDFKRYRLTVDNIVKDWSSLIERLNKINPKLKIIFTVSPIRHLRDGAHDNQISKATLLLAIDQLNSLFINTSYFPSYEILIDDLRDYRFYETDMCHPNTLGIEYIWEKLKETYLPKEAYTIIDEWTKIKQAIDHRPFNEESKEHTHFLKQTLLKLNDFESKYPYICSSSERNILEDKVNQQKDS